jgi:hypothetical protein
MPIKGFAQGDETANLVEVYCLIPNDCDNQRFVVSSIVATAQKASGPQLRGRQRARQYSSFYLRPFCVKSCGETSDTTDVRIASRADLRLPTQQPQSLAMFAAIRRAYAIPNFLTLAPGSKRNVT